MKLIAKKGTEFEKYVKECVSKINEETKLINQLVLAYCEQEPTGRSSVGVFEWKYISTWKGFDFKTPPSDKHFKKVGNLYDVIGRQKEGRILRKQIEAVSNGIALSSFDKFGIPMGGKGFYFGWSVFSDEEKDICGLNVSSSMYDHLELSDDLQFTIGQDK